MLSKTIHVAGDVCIDVLGVPQPRQSSDATSGTENWRLTGEIRAHHRRGGSLLLADMVAAAARSCTVLGPTLQAPEALRLGKAAGGLDETLFPRLTRDEIVHSVIRVEQFRTSDADKKGKTLRVARTEGFSGPLSGTPSVKIEPPASPEVHICVLDDAGNSFRQSQEQWPAAILRSGGADGPLIVHKLHRPIPLCDSAPQTPASASLWETLTKNHPAQRVVIVSVEDLRSDDVPISRGLSWERTALDVVWHLSNLPRWKALQGLPHLIVRLGLDGALYWRGRSSDGNSDCRAWLIYSPDAIEGSWESSVEGAMVAYGSAFTAGLVKKLAESDGPDLLACTTLENGEVRPPAAMIEGIGAGLGASRRLLQLGFGKDALNPGYPGDSLFEPPGEDVFFACQQVPIIPEAGVPDRGYWRLIESIFSGKTRYLHRAVAQVARGARVSDRSRESEETIATKLLRQVPVAVFDALRAYDRREIESYRALYSLMADYVRQPTARRPLSVAVFGPPGAGKSFGVKMVAKALANSSGRKIDDLTFNLSQYKDPDELAAAFHLVRDVVLRGRIPLVFFDEFDTALAGKSLGWLRYFLSPMQDGEFVDRGTPHPIGQSIFVFAGGTCDSCAEFAKPFRQKDDPDFRAFKDAKGPDFLSRLRGTLDIPGLDLDTRFDAYGPTEAFPCEAAILLRRANILAFQLRDKAPGLEDASKALEVSEPVIRALLHLPGFAHGNRSLEALLDMSHLVGEHRFTPSLLPCSNHSALHANSAHLLQLLATDFPFPASEREEIAQAVHGAYLEWRKKDGSFDPKDRSTSAWEDLAEDLRESNRQQADHIAVKLRRVGLWFRKMHTGLPVYPDVESYFQSKVEPLAQMEHDRWVAEKRRDGWIPVPDMDRNSLNKPLRLHNSIFPWEKLSEETKEYDLRTVRLIPQFLRAGGYEIYAPLDNDTGLPRLDATQ